MNTPTTAERIARKLYDSGYVGGPMSSHQQNIEQLTTMIRAELEREQQQVRKFTEKAEQALRLGIHLCGHGLPYGPTEKQFFELATAALALLAAQPGKEG